MDFISQTTLYRFGVCRTSYAYFAFCLNLTSSWCTSTQRIELFLTTWSQTFESFKNQISYKLCFHRLNNGFYNSDKSISAVNILERLRGISGLIVFHGGLFITCYFICSGLLILIFNYMFLYVSSITEEK